jgi:hypothetical protein
VRAVNKNLDDFALVPGFVGELASLQSPVNRDCLTLSEIAADELCRLSPRDRLEEIHRKLAVFLVVAIGCD